MSILNEGIKYLANYNNIQEPLNFNSFNTFRALMNITMPNNLSIDFYRLQDEIIKNEYKNKKLINIKNLDYLDKNILLYQGDITLLKVDAIVNACNSELLGCFRPLHQCIDNSIHSYAGLQVRKDLIQIMAKQNHKEPNGKVKVTNGYNLPSGYIFHTVGPIVNVIVTEQNKIDLKNCYLSCLKKALEMKLSSIAFPCISTGVYCFPNKLACSIAYETVYNFLKENNYKLKVIFVTFKDKDYQLYKLKGNK